MRNALEVLRRRPVSGWVMRSEFDELFDRAFRSPWVLFQEMKPETNPETKAESNPETNTEGMKPITRELFQPVYDIEENESAYLLTFDVPGVRQEDIHLDLKGHQLSVSGERKRESESTIGSTRRSYGKFQQSFNLPSTIDSERVEAHLENGVLMIVLPKADTARARRIEVTSK